MKIFLTVLKQVFGKAEYLLLFLGGGVLVFLGAMTVRNFSLLEQIFGSDSFSIWQKYLFLVSFIGSINETFGFLGSILLIIIAILFALNLTLLVFYIRKVKSILKGSKRIHAVSIGGLVSGLLGIGCAACGSIVLTAVLSSIGASGLLVLLPLHGSEFGFLGAVLLSFSIYELVKRISEPIVC